MNSTWLPLLVGSVAGGFARFGLSGFLARKWGTGFPYGTLTVNLAGCFLIGLLDVLAEKKLLLDPKARLLLMTGFCGAFTTFSTLMLETGHLIKNGAAARAGAYVAASFILGYLCYRLGTVIGKVA